MIKKTIVILLAMSINMPVLNCNATVNEILPEPNSMIKVEDTINTFPNSALHPIEQQFQEKKKENEELKKQEEERKRVQAINDENTRRNNVHVYYADVTSTSGITAEELSQVFNKLNEPKMAQYSQAFIDAEKEYGVNALFLAAIAAQESGWGSKAGGTNGTNLTGHCVYNSQSIGTTFNSGYESIMETAKLLRNNYLTSGAKNFHGYGVEDVNTDYCLHQDMKTTDYTWTGYVVSIENLLEKTYHHKVKTLLKVN
jgi:beta-N-acetylglucosaminidase